MEPLYGRQELVDALARGEAPLTLLTGDSGVGKTRVLNAAADPRAGWVNSSPRRVTATSGAVRRALLEGLADIAALLVSERGAPAEFGDRLIGATERYARGAVQELGRVLGAELLEFVRGRLGPQFGKEIADYVRQLRQEIDDSVVARLAAASDQSAAEVLASFAAEVVALAGGRRIAVSLDSGERLNQEEARLLVDLAELLPEGGHIRLAFATYGGVTAARVEELRVLAPASHEIVVGPLDAVAIREWLAAESVDENVEKLLRATGGYPLHVGDALRELQRGVAIGEVPLNEEVALRAESSWRDLSTRAALMARRLCVLEDPFPEPLMLELAGVEGHEYYQRVDELVRSRMFVTEVAGVPWFHEQRRAFVRKKLAPSELDAASTDAANLAWRALADTDEPVYVGAFANLVKDSRAIREEDAKLDAVLRLDEVEHAVMAALVELMTPENRGAAEADLLFRETRRFTDLPLNPVETLSQLESVGLVVTASNDHATVVVPVLTPRAVAIVQGAAYRRLKREPIPELSNLVLHVGVLPLLGGFHEAGFGMGRPSIGGLARRAAGGDAEVGFGTRAPNRNAAGAHVLARGDYAERPIWLVATYDQEAERDVALERLGDLRLEIFGEELSIRDVIRHPNGVVPAQHFVNAAARSMKLRPFDVRETGDIRVELTEAMELERLYELRVETAKLVRDRATPIERYAMELETTFGLYWDERDNSRIECTVYGGPEAAVRKPGLMEISQGDRYVFFEIEQALNLGPAANLQNVTGHWGRIPDLRHPVFSELARRRQCASAFNSAQPRRRVVIEQRTLEELVGSGFRRYARDARAFARLVPEAPEPLPPLALYVYILVEPPVNGFVAGCGSEVIALELAATGRSDEVHFAISEGGVDLSGSRPIVTGNIGALFAEAFGFSPDDAENVLAGRRTHGIASLLSRYTGFSEDDITLRWPGDPE